MVSDPNQGNEVENSAPGLRPIADEALTAADDPEPNQTGNHSPDVKRLGKYELIRKIGAGGMGSVFLAKDTELSRLVALKILPKDKAVNDVLVKRFQAEAQAAAHLRHDNIVLVYEARKANGYLYIALEYVDGTDGYQLISNGDGKGNVGVPVRRSIEIVEQTARALDHAFQQGIVHRDIKPSNLLISKDGTVKLADMGLARSVDDNLETSITRAGTTVGTVDYMAPEQARDSKAADVRSDIYSLGCTWYHMLVGSAPFPKGSLTNKLFYHAAKNRPDPRKIVAGIPEGVVTVLHKMMARNPKDRYQTPSDLLEALAGIKALVNENDSSPFVDALGEVVEGDTAQAVATSVAPPPAVPRARQQRSARPGSNSRQAVPFPVNNKMWIGLAGGVVALIGIITAAVMLSSSSVPANPGDAVTTPDTGNSDPDNNASEPPETTVVDATNAGPSNPNAGGTENPDTPSPGPSDTPPEPKLVAAALPEYAAWTLPEWIELAETAKPPGNIVHVGRPQAGPAAQFEDINSAIQKLPPEGGTIELVGNGPFFLAPIVIKNQKNLWLTAQDGSNPMVVLKPDGAWKKQSLIRMEGGHLTLVGIHLALFSKQFVDRPNITMLEMAGSDLTVKNCSISVVGARKQNTTAIAFAGRGDWPDRKVPHQGRVLIENTLVQGNMLEAIRVDDVNVSLMARDSLFRAGTAAVVKQSPHQTSPPEIKEPSCIYRFDRCSLVSNAKVFDLEASEDRSNIPWSYLATRNCVLGTPSKQQSNDPAMLALTKWPKLENLPGSQYVPDRLSWDVENSLFFGWNTLARADAVRVGGSPTWRRFWKTESIPESTFQQPTNWPKRPVADGPILDLTIFDTADLTAYSDQTSPNGIPGCEIASLHQPDKTTLSHALAFIEKPILPSVLAESPKDKVEYVDIDSLATEVNGGEHPDGTVFVVIGSGYKSVDQLRIIDRTYTIRFYDDSLLIRPSKLDLRTEQATPDDGAFIYLRNANLILDGIRFRIPPASDPPSRWFLKAEDSNVAIKNSYIRGPVFENARDRSPRYKGLVQWTYTQGDDASARPSGQYRNQFWIQNSFMHTDGMLLQADMRGNALTIDNSLLVASDDVVALTSIGPHLETVGTVSFNSVTSVCGNTFLALPQIGWGNQYRFFVEQSVFIPPVAHSSSPSRNVQLLSVNQQEIQDRLERKQMEWWGISNAVASEVRLFSDPNSFKGDEATTKWTSLLPAGNIQRIMSGKDLQVSPSATIRSQLQPSDFAINPASRAATWSITGKPLGANVASLPFSDSTNLPPPKALPKDKTESTNPVIEKKNSDDGDEWEIDRRRSRGDDDAPRLKKNPSQSEETYGPRFQFDFSKLKASPGKPDEDPEPDDEDVKEPETKKSPDKEADNAETKKPEKKSSRGKDDEDDEQPAKRKGRHGRDDD